MQEKGRASICLLRCLPRPSTLSLTAEPKAEQLFIVYIEHCFHDFTLNLWKLS